MCIENVCERVVINEQSILKANSLVSFIGSFSVFQELSNDSSSQTVPHELFNNI